MARIIKKVIFIAVIFLGLVTIKSYANELILECQKNINPETQNTLEYTLKGNFTENVNSIKVRYTFSEGVELKNFTPSGSWNLELGGTSETTGLVLRVGDTDVTGEIEFGKFILNIPSSYSKETITFKVYDLDATNTNCDLIEFESEKFEGKVNNLLWNEVESEDHNTNNDEIYEGESSNNSNDNQNDDFCVISDNNSVESNYSNLENENDSTVSKSAFGQFGDKSFLFLIILSIVVTVIFFKLFMKLKNI